MNEKLPNQVQEFSAENCPNELQNSVQTLIILWPVYPIHTNSLFWVIFEKLPFCYFLPPNTSTRGKDSQIQLIFHLNIFKLVFQTNGKKPCSFPVLSHFCNCLLLTVTNKIIYLFMFFHQDVHLFLMFLVKFQECLRKLDQEK